MNRTSISNSKFERAGRRSDTYPREVVSNNWIILLKRCLAPIIIPYCIVCGYCWAVLSGQNTSASLFSILFLKGSSYVTGQLFTPHPVVFCLTLKSVFSLYRKAIYAWVGVFSPPSTTKPQYWISLFTQRNKVLFHCFNVLILFCEISCIFSRSRRKLRILLSNFGVNLVIYFK